MKMEAAITCTIAGTIGRVAIPATQQVEAGDLLVVIDQAGEADKVPVVS
jgi:Pyruvate carboxylase